MKHTPSSGAIHQQAFAPASPCAAARRRLLSLPVLILVAFGASAQTPSPADVERAAREADRIMREQEQYDRRQREADALRRQKPSGEATQAPPPGPEKGLPEKCVDVRSLELVGAERLAPEDIAGIERLAVGKCVGLGEINEVLRAITNLYAGRGYITTRAYVPPQDLTTGKLTIVVVEGLVERIEAQPPGAVSIDHAFPGLQGKILNLRDFEQGIDQINRLSSNAAKIDVRPGETPGGSVVIVNNSPRRRWAGYASLDNSGSEPTGRNQGALNLNVDDPLGMDDGLTLSHRQNVGAATDNQQSRAHSLNYSLPYGYSTTTFSYSDFSYRSEVAGQKLSFVSSGDSDTETLRFDRVTFRDQASKLTLAATLTRRSNRNFIAGQLIGVSSRTLTMIDLDSNLSRVVDGAVWSFDLGASHGKPMFGALQDPSNLPGSAPRAEFTKLKFGASVSAGAKLGGRDVSWSSALSGQYADDVLYASEQMGITGPYAVRGFRTGSLAGDNALYWRNELGMPLSVNIADAPISLRPFVGYDVGTVRQKMGVAGGVASGWTVGFSASLGGASLQTSYSQSLRRWAALSDRDSYFSARLSASF